MAQRQDIPLCAVPWYYNLTEESAITVRYMIEMKDPIDGDALRRAVDISMTRYPYLMKRVVADDSRYYLEDNDRPVAVVNTQDPIHLGSEEANYHQIALSYWKNFICFNNTHAIFDGRGRYDVLHTIVYYYCTYRYNETVDMPGVKLAGSPIDPSEYEDPYSKPFPEITFSLPEPLSPKKVFRMDKAGLVTNSEAQIHRLRISEKSLMACCKLYDGTPNTAISILMSRAIQKVHPENTLPIVSGIYCDLRSALEVPHTHQCLVTTLPLAYDNRLADLEFGEQNTIYRGMMMVLAEPSRLVLTQKFQKAACKAVNALPTLKEKTDAAIGAMQTLFLSHSFLVSYSGKSNFGSCNEHIAAFFSQPYTRNFNMLIEVTSADGWFDLAISQEWQEDVYFNAFLKELTSLGLEYDLLYSAPNVPAKFCLK